MLHETLNQASTVQQIENNPPFSASTVPDLRPHRSRATTRLLRRCLIFVDQHSRRIHSLLFPSTCGTRIACSFRSMCSVRCE